MNINVRVGSAKENEHKSEYGRGGQESKRIDCVFRNSIYFA